MKARDPTERSAKPDNTPTSRSHCHVGEFLPLLLLLILSAAGQAQFNYTVDQGKATITGYTGPGGAAIIPDTIEGLPVTSIGAGAFWQCTHVTSVVIPDSVTRIGDNAFSGCTGLTSVTMSHSVTSLGESAFAGCTGLISARIPRSVTNIWGLAFSGCTSLTSVTICASQIGYVAFGYCTSLTSVTIDNGVTRIGDAAFVGCTGLTAIRIPDSLTQIDPSAFSGCASLTSVTIGKSVTSIGWRAFEGCSHLGAVYFQGNAPSQVHADTFEGSSPIVYYLPGRTGWAQTIAGRPTALWIPLTVGEPPLTTASPLNLLSLSPAPATARVQRSVDLVDWEDWQTVSRDEGPSELQDSEAGAVPCRFYRLLVD